jgi:hypothetical protein
MFHDVCDVDLFAIDAGFGQGSVQQLAGGPDKGFSGKILVVARLFTHEHHLRVACAFPKYRLGTRFPQRTGPAAAGGVLQFHEGWSSWDK